MILQNNYSIHFFLNLKENNEIIRISNCVTGALFFGRWGNMSLFCWQHDLFGQSLYEVKGDGEHLVAGYLSFEG